MRRGAGAAIRAFGLVIFALSLAAMPAAARERFVARDIEVTAYPLKGFAVGDPERRGFGRLTFLGGIELRGRDPDFGGISAGVIDADGEGFTAISDNAHWITGRIIVREGAPVGIAGMRIAPMNGPDGEIMFHSRNYDSEGLARQGNSFFVSYERTHEIFRFERQPGGAMGRARPVPAPPLFKRLDRNRGMEALGVLPAGSPFAGQLVAIAERAPPSFETKDHVGFILGPGGGRFALRRIGAYDVTDLAFHPDGDLLVLERRFEPLLGLGFRIRRVPLAAVRPGAVLDGEILIQAEGDTQIDNMEALMVHRAGDGRTILTIMSDDNFSILQRTLLLRFAIVE